MPEKNGAPLSRRQLGILLLSVMVSPLIRQVPGAMTLPAGRGVWLSALLCLPGAALLGAFLGALLKNRGPGEGLGELLCRCFGNVPGRAAAALFALWLIFYAGFVLRAGADRFVSAVYPESPVWLFMAVMLLLCLPAGLGKLKTLARCAQIIAPALGLVFAVVFVFCFQNVETDNLWPLRPEDLAGAGPGALPLLTTLSVGAHLTFAAGETEPGALGKTFALPLLALAGLGLLLCVTTVGTFGAELTERMNYPFFVMIRSIRIFNVLERVEALVVAQWVAADFLLLGTLLHIAPGALSLALFGPGGKRPRWTGWLCAALLGVSGWLCAPTAFTLRWVARTVVPAGNALLVFGLLPLAFVIGKMRKKI